MSDLGFRPVCVMYHSNGSQLDGTYRLVCRHQIQEKDFYQDDIVHVQGSDQQTLEAIVMGDELVSSLLRSLYPSPSMTQNQSSLKRKRDSDDQGLTSSDSNCLQHILSTVKDIKTEVVRQGQELNHIKHKQFQIETKLALLQDSIFNTDDHRPEGDMSMDGPDEPGWITTEEIISDDQQSTDQITRDDTNGHSVINVTLPLNVDERRKAPIYLFDNDEEYLANLIKNSCEENMVTLGSSDFSVKMAEWEMQEILGRSHHPSSFAYRLADKVYTMKELVEGNTKGGVKKANGFLFNRLNPKGVILIMEEVKKRFPDAAKHEKLERDIKNAINDRARNIRKAINRKKPAEKCPEEPTIKVEVN